MRTKLEGSLPRASGRGWVLNHGDGIAGLTQLKSLSVDHAFFDPPYSQHVHESIRSGSTERTSRDARFPGRRIAFAKDIGFAHLSLAHLEEAIAELARVVRRWIGVFSDVESCHFWRESAERHGLEYIRTVGWDKFGGAPQFTGDRPAVGFETITMLHRPGQKWWNGGGKRGMYSHSVVLPQRGELRLHPAQKPLALMQDLVRDFTDRGELIIDPFAGAATTALAARTLGRRSISWERDPKFYADAVARMRGAV